MYSLITDYSIGTLNVGETYSSTKMVNDYLIIRIGFGEPIEDVSKIKNIKLNTIDITPNSNIQVQYRISRDGVQYSEWLSVLVDTDYTVSEQVYRIDNFPIINSIDPFYMDIKVLKMGVNPIGILGYNIEGTLERSITEGNESFIVTPGNSIVIKPPYIYKVFSITDIEKIVTNPGADIKYRFSQDYGRTVTEWEPFTKENISTKRITPIRFFQIEYLVTNNTNTSLMVNDINLIGDFQNVTLDYKKTNLYGIRENCSCLALNIVNGVSIGITQSGSEMINEANSSGSSIMSLYGNSCNGIGSKQMTAEERANLFNPYAQNQAIDFLNQVSNDSTQVFGHEVVYFLTDPDKNGIDYTFHEYQLYNYVCSEILKVSVDQNNFPDSQIAINQFDLSLFDTFEIHITKDAFKSVFGVEKRPSKEDFLWFCNLNRMYQVEHAQPFRSFNNSAIYYKVMLKKFTQKASVIAGSKNIEDRVRELTRNSTIDELFGIEIEQDKLSVANKEQHITLTKDTLRVELKTRVVKELIQSRNNIISRNNYDLSYGEPNTEAVVYRNMKQHFKVSDNIGFFAWFNINEYVVNDRYSLFNYYDTDNNLGLDINILNGGVNVSINTDTYTLPFNQPLGDYVFDDLSEGSWHCYLVNIDQRQRKITQYIYTISDLVSPSLNMVYKKEEDLSIVDFFIPDDVNAKLITSDMKITNISLFSEIIPEEEHIKIVSSAIIRDDSKHLIFVDNANQKLVLPNYSISQEK